MSYYIYIIFKIKIDDYRFLRSGRYVSRPSSPCYLCPPSALQDPTELDYWSLGALKILFNSALALSVPAVVSRKVVV